ncbi:MAG: hypothetical protein ICV87_05480, partial [Gemmatimonadetes bacterium]|nr:hypothetical protein [Gemmatimonadota bacterium]
MNAPPPRAARMLLLAAGLASCTDGLVGPVPESHAPPAGQPRAFVAPVSDAVVASAAIPVPATNTYQNGAQPWTLVHTFPQSGYYELRTVGKIRWRRNEEAALTGCSAPGCQSPADVNGPSGTEGSVGGAGIAGGELRTSITITTGEVPYSGDPGMLLETTSDSQVVVLVAAGSRRSVYVKTAGIQGVRSCAGDACGGMLPGPTGWYLLHSEARVEAHAVTPLQVEPNKSEFVPGEVLTWTTERHRLVQERTSWYWIPEGGYRTYVPCSGKTCSYAPPGAGTMLVVSYYKESGWDVEVSASAAVKVRQPKLQVTCAPARIPLGNETRCVASVDLPVSTFTVQSWSYSGTATPPLPTGDVKEWTFKPGEIVTGTVTITAQVGAGTQTATAQVEVVCNFFQRPTGDTIWDRADVQDWMRQLWIESNP